MQRSASRWSSPPCPDTFSDSKIEQPRSECQRLSALAETASDWWWEMDADLRFTVVSDGFTETFGIPASDVLGKRRTDLARTDYETSAWRAHCEDLSARRPFRGFETTFVDARGTSRPVRICGTPQFTADGEFSGYIGVGLDLTAFHQRQTEAEQHAANLRSILESVDQGVVLLSAELKVLAHNRQFAEWLHFDPSHSLVGAAYEQTVRELADRGVYEPENKENAIARRMRVVRSTKRFVGERRTRDGRTVLITYAPQRAGGGVMTYSDVTEAREREARLARSEASFRQVFQHSPLPKWVYSKATRKFVEVNDAAIATYGYSREEFLTLKLDDMCPPEDEASWHAWSSQSRADRLRTQSWRHRCKDGRLVDVDVTIRELEFQGEDARMATMVDTTARKAAERQTERIFQTSQDVILVTDSRGTVGRASPSTERIIGYPPNEIVGRLAHELMLPDDVAAAQLEMQAARSGISAHAVRSRFVHREGHVVPVMWTAAWSERDQSYFFIGRDMTEHERTESVLRQAQKMEAVGQMTSGIAHDFNNLLAVIIMKLEMMGEELSEDSPQWSNVSDALRAANRGADLVARLVAFSRRRELKAVKTDIASLLHRFRPLIEAAVPKVSLSVDAPGDVHACYVDQAALETAILNLAVNARDAMPSGGPLRIAAVNRSISEEEALSEPGAIAGNWVRIAVIDRGTGIAPHLVEKVFEPFFTTKEEGKGTGLGLSMVSKFVQQSGGFVTIDSSVGRGTTIAMHLPASPLLQ